MLSIKKILAFTAMVIIVAPVFVFLSFFIKQKIIQHTMIEKLENASLKCIALSHGEFKWVKENKEIEVNGKLFDVKYFSVRDGKIYFIGLYDNEEDEVKKKINDFAKNNDTNKIPQQALIKFLFYPAINTNEQFVFYSPDSFIKNEYCFFQEEEVFRHSQKFSPPPNN